MITKNAVVSKVKESQAKLFQPGKVTYDVTLILHTKQAYRFINGFRTVKGPLGLFNYARTVLKIYQSAQFDNPYAEWCLLKIYDAIKQAEAEFKHQKGLIRLQLAELKHFTIENSVSNAPFEVPLSFSTPYAYLTANLIGIFDEWVSYWLTTKAMGIKLTELHFDLMRKMQRLIFRVYNKAFQWKPSDVTRIDVREMNQRYQLAEKTFGVLPAAILDKKITVPFLVPRMARMEPLNQFENDLREMK